MASTDSECFCMFMRHLDTSLQHTLLWRRRRPAWVELQTGCSTPTCASVWHPMQARVLSVTGDPGHRAPVPGCTTGSTATAVPCRSQQQTAPH